MMESKIKHARPDSSMARDAGRCMALIVAAAAVAFPAASHARLSVELANPPAPTAQPAKKAARKAADKAAPVKDAKDAGGGKDPLVTQSKTQAAAPVCIGELPPAINMAVPEGKSGLVDLQRLRLPAPAWLRTVGDPEVVQVEPLTSPSARNMFFLFGKKTGATNLMFQHADGRCAIVEVSVGMDTAAVQASIRQLLPMEKDIKVSAAANSLVVSGLASDAGAVAKIMTIASAFVRGGDGDPTARIVNMMSVGAPQQVMLEVKVAEISKTLLEKLGVNLAAAGGKGSIAFSLLSNFATQAGASLQVQKPGGNDSLLLDAERKNGLVKILAEPTVMAISGQDGSFLAGGRIFIPVSQDANGRISLEEKEFGVGLRFTPTVLDGGRINLKVAPEVSELSREGVGISSTGTGGNAVLPLITTRRASTTVQLFDGQSFVIGGLIRNNVTESIKALPVIGDLPVLGALFRSTDFQTDKTELVFIVTPRLVKPLPQSYPLPTDKFIEPSRKELFLDGKLEGTVPQEPQSPQAPQALQAPQPVTDSGTPAPLAASGFQIN